MLNGGKGKCFNKFLFSFLRNEEDDDDILKYLETPKQKRSRYISLGIISFTSFTFNLGFSLVLTSAYPYLVEVSDSGWRGVRRFCIVGLVPDLIKNIFFLKDE